MNDHAEVCPPSRRAMSQPVSHPLQTGIRFLRTPLPTAPTAFLAVRLPLPATRWAYPVPHKSQDGADPSNSTGGIVSMMAHVAKAIPAAHLLVQACQHVWLVLDDDAFRTFTCVGRTHPSLAPPRLCAGRFRFASRLGVPDNPAATLFPEFHTKPLPASHVRVGNGRWNSRFHQVIASS